MNAHASPVGGPILTRPLKILLGVLAVGLLFLAWRFAAGLGGPTALNDGYPWGLWIAFDVVTGTALACGGYAIAILVYVLNRGRYHPLVRPALVTSALGYTLGGLAVVIDVGRYWNVWKLPLFFWKWNLSSILLEVALCIVLYTLVLWIELAPAFLDRWSQEGTRSRLRELAGRITPRLEKAMPWLIALGLLLPTMHQSSLGSLMLLAGPKLHGLWLTPLLPLLFLVSCVGMGYGVVVMESSLASALFGRRPETRMLSALSTPMAIVLLLFVAIRGADIVYRGRLDLVATLDGQSILFLAEMALFLVPAIALLLPGVRRDLSQLFRLAILMVLAGTLYRFSTYLIAYDPGGGWSYFPAVPEILVTVGLIAAEVIGYILIVKRFPILSGAPEALGT